MVTIRNLPLGTGIPKICVPLVGRTEAAILTACKSIQPLPYDVLELRIDYFEGVTVMATVTHLLQSIRAILPDAPLLFTFRTKAEGGEQILPEDTYFTLLQHAIQSGLIDAVDIEYFRDRDGITETVGLAKEKGVTVVMSNHDFAQTPSKEDLVQRLIGMKDLGADVPKIACMPNSVYDVLRLLAATTIFHEEHYPDVPIITMSMGKLGVISRVSGETFGSCLTFGAATQASAPGQLDVTALRAILQALH